MSNVSKMCEDHLMEINAAISRYNTALAANDAAAMSVAEGEAKTAVKEYNDQMELDLIQRHKDDDNPVYGVLKEAFIPTLKTHVLRDEGVTLALEVVPSERMVSLARVFKVIGRKIEWKDQAQNLAYLLTARASKGVGLSVEALRDQYKMSAKAKSIQTPPNPLSNTSLLKVLQSVIDSIIYEDDGKGHNVYKAYNADLNFVLECFTREGKGRYDIDTAKNPRVVNLVVKVISKIINNERYKVNFKAAKGSEGAVQDTAPIEIPAPDAEQTDDPAATTVVDRA